MRNEGSSGSVAALRGSLLDARVARVPLSERRGAPLVLGTIGVAVTLLVLELASRLGVVPSQYIPPVSDVLRTTFDQLTNNSFWHPIWQTIQGWGIGLGIAAAIGIPLGLAIGSSKVLWHALRPTIEFLRPIPSISLIPITILSLGNGVKGNVFLTAFGALWPLLIQTVYGVREIDPVGRDTLRSFHVGPISRIRFLIFPSTLPFIATGMRIASAIALIVAVTCELVIGTPGIGYSLALAQNGGNYKLMYAFVLAAGLLGLAIHWLFSAVERRALRAYPSQRARESVA
jgi:ABC-type nitrate/sulfonate/bicarbonate transport system permease component